MGFIVFNSLVLKNSAEDTVALQVIGIQEQQCQVELSSFSTPLSWYFIENKITHVFCWNLQLVMLKTSRERGSLSLSAVLFLTVALDLNCNLNFEPSSLNMSSQGAANAGTIWNLFTIPVCNHWHQSGVIPLPVFSTARILGSGPSGLKVRLCGPQKRNLKYPVPSYNDPVPFNNIFKWKKLIIGWNRMIIRWNR